MQNHISQTVKTHKHSGILATKIIVSKPTQHDAEAVRLAKHAFQNTHLKDFDYDVTKNVGKVRELVATLEANDVLSSSHVDDVLAVFKDKSCCEDFRLHLKMFEMDKLKGITLDIELMLTELDAKCTNLVKQNEWSVSTPASKLDSKCMAMTAKASEANKVE